MSLGLLVHLIPVFVVPVIKNNIDKEQLLSNEAFTSEVLC